MSNTSKIRAVVFCTLILLIAIVVRSDERGKPALWVSMDARIKIWDEVVAEQLGLKLPLLDPKPYRISSNEIEAIYEKDGHQWTIIGANAPIVYPTAVPRDWPVKGDNIEVLVIPEPITNYKILPFTTEIENGVRSDTISITAAQNSYEPVSFVVRSGDTAVKDLQIEVTDLVERNAASRYARQAAVISRSQVDIRVVKCWYQAGVAIDDVAHKLLTPELLVHDDDIVGVDYLRQVNLLRSFEEIADTDALRPFDVPRHQNKQIWITVHVKPGFTAGVYEGAVKLRSANKMLKNLNLVVRVLPFELPEPMISYGLYYEGYLSGNNKRLIGWRPKTEEQMLAELVDMREHGLTNATVWHRVNTDSTQWAADWGRLRRTLELRQQIGWGDKPLLYLDWHTAFRDDLALYSNKVKKIVSIANEYGIKDVYIYGVDERKGKDLLSLRPVYKVVHEAGAKNFVAVSEDFLLFVPELLDMPVLNGEPAAFYMTVLKTLKKNVLSYGNPQAGLEEPETYRRNYGIGLFSKGFQGALDYVYQHGECWNDFVDYKYRSHTMAYPTTSKPIPTIQWEGWRAGVTDVRYLTLLKKEKALSDDLVNIGCNGTATDCRNFVVQKLLNKEK